jgi:hypothetical protein
MLYYEALPKHTTMSPLRAEGSAQHGVGLS